MSRIFPMRYQVLNALVATAMATSPALALDAEKEDLPPILQSIERQGIRVLGEMQVPGGLRGFAAKAGSQPIAIYLTPDQNHVIVGTLVDADGQDMAGDQMKKLAETPILQDGWDKLSRAAWVKDGADNAPRTVYVFTDPNCPYCNAFWLAARPWVESGKVQLRHVMVGVIRQDSPGKAAAILDAASPSDALVENETKHKTGGIAASKSIKAQTADKLNNNADLMTALGFAGTPAIIFRKDDGTIGNVAGMPSSGALEMIFGPK